MYVIVIIVQTHIAKTIKKNGVVACLQIAHMGAQGNTHYTGERVVGPSKYIVPDIGIEAQVLSIDEIINIEDEFSDVELILWPQTFNIFKRKLREPLFIAHGEISRWDGTTNVIVRDIEIIKTVADLPLGHDWRLIFRETYVFG